MTQQEILSLVQAGYTKADIEAMTAPQGNLHIVSPEPLPNNYVQEPLPDLKAQASTQDFITQLAQLGAQTMLLQKPQPQPQPQPQPVQPQQVAQTPSNSGITPEEATKLFQAWSQGAATQNIELPPTADEVLTKRFASLYGADTSKSN